MNVLTKSYEPPRRRGQLRPRNQRCLLSFGPLTDAAARNREVQAFGLKPCWPRELGSLPLLELFSSKRPSRGANRTGEPKYGVYMVSLFGH